MSNNGRQQPDQMIDDYVDGVLSEPQRAAFERRLETDSLLRAELERQSRIDAALDNLFTPPPPDNVLAAVQADRRPAQPAIYRLFTFNRLAVAAVLLIAILGGWLYMSHVRGPLVPPGPRYVWHSLQEVYEYRVADGFQPDWSCPDREFAYTFYNNHGAFLLLAAELPDDVVALGLGYNVCISRTTQSTLLVIRVKGEPVLLFVDRREADPVHTLPDASKLHLFRRELGELVIYELTPFDQPSVLDLLYIPTESDPRLQEPAQPSP